MEKKKFQKQKLNKEDHKKTDDIVRIIRWGGTIVGVGTLIMLRVVNPKAIRIGAKTK